MLWENIRLDALPLSESNWLMEHFMRSLDIVMLSHRQKAQPFIQHVWYIANLLFYEWSLVHQSIINEWDEGFQILVTPLNFTTIGSQNRVIPPAHNIILWVYETDTHHVPVISLQARWMLVEIHFRSYKGISSPWKNPLLCFPLLKYENEHFYKDSKFIFSINKTVAELIKISRICN